MIQRTRRHAKIAFFGIILALGGPAAGGDLLPTPQGKILLTVYGHIQKTNVGDTAQFDLAMLDALGRIEFETNTIWTDGSVTFTGVPLSALLDTLGVTSGTLKATAVNDYIIEIPVADVEPDAPIIAHHMNGEQMARRDKGPLWIVYPYDRDEKYQTEVTYSRSIWQLDRIEAVK